MGFTAQLFSQSSLHFRFSLHFRVLTGGRQIARASWPQPCLLPCRLDVRPVCCSAGCSAGNSPRSQLLLSIVGAGRRPDSPTARHPHVLHFLARNADASGLPRSFGSVTDIATGEQKVHHGTQTDSNQKKTNHQPLVGFRREA